MIRKRIDEHSKAPGRGRGARFTPIRRETAGRSCCVPVVRGPPRELDDGWTASLSVPVSSLHRSLAVLEGPDADPAPWQPRRHPLRAKRVKLSGHHHHLVCTKDPAASAKGDCGMRGRMGEALSPVWSARSPEAPASNLIHTLEIEGWCAECA